MGGMTIEKFGEMIDWFLTSIDAKMLIEMPEGTLDVQVQDNIDCGPVMQLYILLNTIRPIAAEMRKLMEIDGKSKEWVKTADTLLGMVRNELLEGES